jgi:SNF2 family DNA or RNA helicase
LILFALFLLIAAKSLVFSQFRSTLSWMQEELPKHGFQFRTLSGDMPMSKRACALRDFQNDPPTTIFLLSIRAGACGINLTQANRVFLMEPAMNPALEAQAIGRVYRLGQRKNVEIVRMLMTNSVETRLTKLIETKYGSKDKKGSGTGDDDSDEDEKDTMDRFSSSSIRVGSIQSDRSDMRENEFDLLFGLTS